MADVGSVTVVRDIANGRDFNAQAGHRMYLYSESGRLALAITIAPREIEYGGLAHDWAEADRSGEKPLLLHSGTPLETMGFSFLLTDRHDMQVAQTSQVQALKDAARTFERILLRYSGTEAGLWRITEMSINSELRSDADNEITRATVSITLTEASDPAPAVGPVSKPPPPPPAPKPVNRTHTVKRGDTLWDIARRYYGSGPLWPRIYDANRGKIKDPHWIYPGQVFVIP